MYNYNNYLPNSYFYNNNLRNDNINLYSPKEGYENGNMFVNLYNQYKNYTPQNLKATNEKDAVLLELSKNAFAAHDLMLYLDLNPNDKSSIQLFNDYNKKINNLLNEYESKYGPLTTFYNNFDNFSWESTKWPWEGGES